MAIRIVPHGEEHRTRVDAFNRRLFSKGGELGFYVEPIPDWIPPAPGARVWREYHVAIDAEGEVHGAYALKPQEWQIGKEVHTVADWQGPVSEGQVDPRYGALALRMMRQMLKQRPLLYSYGHGGAEERVIQLVKEMGWVLTPVPFCMRVLKPRGFLRKARLLRSTRARALALDLLAASGLGSVGLRALHWAQKLRHRRRIRPTTYIVQPTFGPWANDVWRRNKHHYGALAVRDADVLNRLFPTDGWPPVDRLQVMRDGETIGWAAVLHRKMNDEPRFGDLHVGNITDCFAAPDDAADLIGAAIDHLSKSPAELVYANMSHPAWTEAMAANGCVLIPNRRMFVTAPPLASYLNQTGIPVSSIFLTNIDGHGPQDFR
jgi:hypothetical protein